MDGIAQGLPGALEDSEREKPATPHSTDQDAAFAALVNRHARFLYRVAFGLLRNSEDAEDAVQETFLKLYRTSAWLSPEGKTKMDDEKAFLARSVWRTGLTRLGSAGAKAMKNAEDVTELDLASPAASPEDHALGASARAEAPSADSSGEAATLAISSSVTSSAFFIAFAPAVESRSNPLRHTARARKAFSSSIACQASLR